MNVECFFDVQVDIELKLVQSVFDFLYFLLTMYSCKQLILAFTRQIYIVLIEYLCNKMKYNKIKCNEKFEKKKQKTHTHTQNTHT